MKLRFITNWGVYGRGDVIEPDSNGFADSMIRQGLCEVVGEEKKVLVIETTESPAHARAETGMMTMKRGPGRPRKNSTGG